MTRFCRTLGNAAVALALFTTGGVVNAASDTTSSGVVSERAQAVAAIETNKAAVVDEILARWQGVLSAEEGSAAKVTESLMKLSAEELLVVQSATRWEEIPQDLFGDLTTDLVYTPLAACRLMDTRIGTFAPYNAPLAPNTTVALSVNDSLAAQGGAAAGCDPGGLGLGTDPPALAIIITAVPTDGSPGNLRTFATGGAIPAAAMLTYGNGVTISSGVITQSCTGCGPELSVRNQGAGTTHVVIDIVGFFHAPNQTAVDNNVLNTFTSILANSTFTVYSPACPAGWRLTGGGFLGSQFSGITWAGSRPTAGASNITVSGVNMADRYLCQGTTGASGQTVTCFSTCARVPGR